MKAGDFTTIFGEVTPLLLVVLVMTIVELAKKTFTMQVWMLWLLSVGLSGLFIGGGYLLLVADTVSPQTIFIALVYTVMGWLASIGAWNVGSRTVDGRLTERAGGSNARPSLGPSSSDN